MEWHETGSFYRSHLHGNLIAMNCVAALLHAGYIESILATRQACNNSLLSLTMHNRH